MSEQFSPPLAHALTGAAFATPTHSSIVYIHALKRYHPSHPRGTVLMPSDSI